MIHTSAVSYNVAATLEIGQLTDLSPVVFDLEEHQDEQIDLLGWYLHEIDRYPLLTEAEERLLAARVVEGDQEARTHLIESNLRLVVSIAKRYQGSDGYGTPLLDLIQYGNVGLIRAVDKYDLTRGARFTTCATLYIKAAVLRALDEQGRLVRLSSYRIAQVRQLLNREYELQHRLARKPTTAELAAHTGKHLQIVEQLLATSQPSLSLDALLFADGDERMLLDVLADEQAADPEQIVCAQEQTTEVSETMQQVLAGLTARERQVLTLRFGLDGAGERNTATICQILGLCPSRVYQLLTAAFEKIRTSPCASQLCRAFLEPRAS
jgi:RNA polymerase sigma factor (sigma-70 family)